MTVSSVLVSLEKRGRVSSTWLKLSLWRKEMLLGWGKDGGGTMFLAVS